MLKMIMKNKLISVIGKQNDIYRPKYHICAPRGWINDPNGLIQFNDEYHVFYQYHPYSTEWGPMHWGHVKSSDMVHWEQLPIALTPGNSYDEGGCFSGSAVDNNGILTLIYTGNQSDINKSQNQCIATSKDGIHFEKYYMNPVIAENPKDGSRDFRDPKVWKHDGKWFMVVGTSKDDIGKVVLYTSFNLIQWNYIGVMLESNGLNGAMWECPDVFELGGFHILITSPIGMKNGKNIYIVGHLDYETGKFTQKYNGELDYGFDFYAAQTFLDNTKRRILYAWMNSWGVKSPTEVNGWVGMLTIPRVLNILSDGRLCMQPVSELQVLRQCKNELKNIIVSKNSTNNLNSFNGNCIEIIAKFDLYSCSSNDFGIKVRCSKTSEEETVVGYNNSTHELYVDINKSGPYSSYKNVDKGISKGKLLIEGNNIEMHIFIDSSSIEVFGNNGSVAISNTIFPSQDSNDIRLFCKDGSVELVSLEVWDLNSNNSE